jgi:thiamine biosynthesis lipoprotein
MRRPAPPAAESVAIDHPTVAVHRFVARAMGSPLRLTVVTDRAMAVRAWDLVRADMELTEAALSRFRPDSDLTRLNRLAGGDAWHRAGRRLRQMVLAGRRAHRITGGRFDPRVLRALERAGERAGIRLQSRRVPDRPWTEIDRWGRLRVAEPLDSGGIGKGLALRWAFAATERAGLHGSGGLLEAGGDLLVWGQPHDMPSWRIGIEDPFGSDVPVAVVDCAGGAMATSSVRIRSWTDADGHRAHHLIDASTGRPAQTGLRSVTVAHADPAWAEVWSKSLFFTGADAIGSEARTRELAAWWVTDVGLLAMSPRADEQTVWVRTDAVAPG